MDAKKVLKYVVLVVVLGNVVLMAFVFLGSPARKPTPMPNPNGYDDFVKAAKLVNVDTSKDYRTFTREELAATIFSTNQEVLSLVRTGLGKQCLMPNDYWKDYQARVFMRTLSAWKEIAFLFRDEGRLAELNGQTNEAAQFYLDGIRFGEECSRGGVLIDKLVGASCSAILETPLRNLLPSLDTKHCADIAANLEKMDASTEPAEEILKREEEYESKISGIREKLAKLVMYKTIRTTRQNAARRFENDTSRKREMMIAFAARAYELEHGKRPASVADLVPNYLKKIPQDPVTGTNLTLPP